MGVGHALGDRSVAEPGDAESAGADAGKWAVSQRDACDAPVFVSVGRGVSEPRHVGRARGIEVAELVPTGGEPRIRSAVVDNEDTSADGDDAGPCGDGDRCLYAAKGDRTETLKGCEQKDEDRGAGGAKRGRSATRN